MQDSCLSIGTGSGDDNPSSWRVEFQAVMVDWALCDHWAVLTRLETAEWWWCQLDASFFNKLTPPCTPPEALYSQLAFLSTVDL